MYRDETIINVAHIIKSSSVNGPGNRFVIWVQGCNKNCKNCSNQDFIPQKPNILYDIDSLFAMIKDNKADIEGVTYSGGEPFEQAKGLFLLGEKIKRIGLTLFCYTGYTLEDITTRGNEDQKRLLQITDILVDGEYWEEKKCNLLWRGSYNQKVHILTSRYKDYLTELDTPLREVEFIIKNGEIIKTGFPNL